MKVLVLTRYQKLGASSRMRMLQFLPFLTRAGMQLVVSSLITDGMLSRKYRLGTYGLVDIISAYLRRIKILWGASTFDLIWIEREALPWLPARIERWLLRKTPYVMDFDDAIFHNYDLHRLPLARWFFGSRIDCLMAGSSGITAGNQYLAARAASAGSRKVEVVPTVVDLNRYAPKNTNTPGAKPRIVWIGSPSTTLYLQDLAKPLAELATRRAYTLRVIGAGALALPGVEVEVFPWTADDEAQLIAECDVGIMPLRNTPWEQGKCAYKLIQYMACGLPTVASAIGANREVVVEGYTGYLVDSDGAWVEQLDRLLGDATLRVRMGFAGRQRIEEAYCVEVMAPALAKVLFSSVATSVRPS